MVRSDRFRQQQSEARNLRVEGRHAQEFPGPTIQPAAHCLRIAKEEAGHYPHRPAVRIGPGRQRDGGDEADWEANEVAPEEGTRELSSPESNIL